MPLCAVFKKWIERKQSICLPHCFGFQHQLSMFVLYIFVFCVTIVALFNVYKSRLIFSQNSAYPEENIEDKKSDSRKSKSRNNKISFESANIVTCSRDDNTCIAIFKNPQDHRTHFYRTRLRGKHLRHL